MRLNEFLPRRVLAAFRRRRDAMTLHHVPHSLIRDSVAKIGQPAHNPIVAPPRILPGHLHDQRLQFRLDRRPAWIAAVFGSIELPGDELSIPGQNCVGLATQATWDSAFRPRRLPISASVALSGSDSRGRAGKWARRMRFSAARYSFLRG